MKPRSLCPLDAKWLFLPILGAAVFAPGLPSKFLMGSGNSECIDSSDYFRFEVRPTRFYSVPPYEGYRPKKNLDIYFHSGPLASGNLDVTQAFRKPRSEVLWHSPAFYWLEQKLQSFQGVPLETKGNYLVPKRSLLGDLFDHGLTRADDLAVEYSQKKPLSFYSGWTDRSPLGFVVLHPDSILDSGCKGSFLQDASLYQRGLFVPWIKAPAVFLSRRYLDALFVGKLRTIVAEYIPWLSPIYFYVEESDGVLVYLSTFDIPLYLRGVVLCLLLWIFSSEILALLRGLGKTRTAISLDKASKLLGLNLLVFSCMTAFSLVVLDLLLSTTSLLDESASRSPSYLPIKSEFINRVNLWTRVGSVNEYGFIDRPVADYDLQAKCKIAVLGDSFVWGWGNAPGSDERWPAQFQKLVPGCLVFYWGQGGWSTRDQVDFLQVKGSKHSVDLILLGFVDNDMSLDPNRHELNVQAVKSLVKEAQAPIYVFFTPWNGLQSQSKVFEYAGGLFRRAGIPSHSCLPAVQEVTGIDKAAPRWMWNGVHVDSHPGYPLTSRIAQCVHQKLVDTEFRSLIEG